MGSVSVCRLSEAVAWCLSVCVGCLRLCHGVCQWVSAVRGHGLASVSVCQLSEAVAWCLSVCVSCLRPWFGVCQCVSAV